MRSSYVVTRAYKRNNQRAPGFIDLPPLPADEAARIAPQQPPRQQPPRQQPQQPPQQMPLDPNFGPAQQPLYNPNVAPGYIDTRQNNNRRNNNNGGYQTFNDPMWGLPPSQKGGWNRNAGFNNRNGGFVGFDDPDSMLLQSFGDMPLGMYDQWLEVDEEEEDLSPKYVNGRRVLVNREIEAPTVRVQDARKEEVGVMSFDDARDLAIRSQADVVMVNEGGDPPVVRIIEFGKYKFEIERATKQKQKSSKGTETKEVRLRPVTEAHDYEVKVKAAEKFLAKGSKVKLTMQFSGREMRFKDQGKEMMLKLIEDLSNVSKMDAPLSLKPSNFSVTLSPKQ